MRQLTTFIVIGFALSTGCGVKVEGINDVKVVHEINVAQLTPYLEAYCGLTNSTQEELDACVSLELGKLITKL
jgi:hypothetical protein